MVMLVDILVAILIEMVVYKMGHILEETVATTLCTIQSPPQSTSPTSITKILPHIPTSLKPLKIYSTAIPVNMMLIMMDGTALWSVANNIMYLM